MQITFGCQNTKIMKAFDQKVFCINNSICLLLIQMKTLIRYDFEKERILSQLTWTSKYKIFDICQSRTHYLVLSEDWNIHFLDFELQTVSWNTFTPDHRLKRLDKIQFEAKQAIHLCYNDLKNQLILVNTSSISVFNLKFTKDILEVKGVQELKGTLEYNRQCKQVNNYALIFQNHWIMVLDKHTLSYYKVKCSSQIVDCTISEYLITAHHDGDLVLYKSGAIVHTFQKSHKKVGSIFVDNNILYSFGDSVIKIWNIEQQKYNSKYPINAIASFFCFLSANKYMFNQNALYLGQLHILETLHIHDSTVLAHSNSLVAFKIPVYYHLGTNLNAFIEPEKNQLALEILDRDDKIYILFEDEILLYQDGVKAKYRFEFLRSINGDKISQEVTHMAFPEFQAPFFDVETTVDQHDRLKVKNTNMIALGCSKGAVLFVSLDKFDVIHTRYNYNKEKILRLGAWKENLLLMVSFDRVVNVLKHSEDKPEIIRTLMIQFPLNIGPNNLVMAVSHDIVFMNKRYECFQPQMSHESDIVDIQISRFVMSQSLTSIKLWNIKGHLLANLHFHCPLDAAILRDSLIVSLDGQLCQYILRDIDDNSEESDKSVHEFGTMYSHKTFFETQISKSPMNRVIEQQNSPQKNQIQQFQERPRGISVKVEQKVNISVDQQNQSMITATPLKRTLLPALPKSIQQPTTILDQFMIRRKKKGPPKNRRDWTMEKIIMGNILSSIN